MSRKVFSSKATDPTASLMALNFQSTWNNYHGDLPGNADDTWEFAFRPVIPFTFLEHPNIFRATIPFQTGGRGEEGFEAITLFDLFMTNESWGRWGIGPVMSFDTTGDAPNEFVIGPAFGGVWKVNKQLSLGMFSQNVFASDTAVTQLQPVIAYQLGEGWSVSAGDLQITYDWEASRWVNLPVGIQIGDAHAPGPAPAPGVGTA